jgi:hypothetical protein
MGGEAMVQIAAALGIAFVPIVDHKQVALVKDLWIKRKRRSDNDGLQSVAHLPQLDDAPVNTGSNHVETAS